MRFEYTPRFRKDFSRLPDRIKRAAEKQLRQLVEDPRQGSLQLKKMQGRGGIREGRVTRGYRFLYRIEGDMCTLLRIGPHSVLE